MMMQRASNDRNLMNCSYFMSLLLLGGYVFHHNHYHATHDGSETELFLDDSTDNNDDIVSNTRRSE